jgi:hypothetical protein
MGKEHKEMRIEQADDGSLITHTTTRKDGKEGKYGPNTKYDETTETHEDGDALAEHVRKHFGGEKKEEKMGEAKHPGFKAVQEKIEKKEGVSKKAAGAMLAAKSRGASKEAKKKNPRLERVRGED